MSENESETAQRQPRRTFGSTAIAVGFGALWTLLWIAVDWWDARPDPEFVPDGVPLFAWYVLAALGLAALLRWRSRPTPAFGEVLALTAVLVPVPLLTAIAATYLAASWLLGLSILAIIGSAYILARGLRSLTGETQRVAAALGILYILGFIWVTNAFDAIPDVWATREEQSAASADGRADAESLLFEQADRIDHALADMDPRPSAKPRSFFLGFAGVGDQKVFAQEVSLASRVLGERYGVDHRRISLINDERDVERAPLASVSGLRYALRGIGARMNLDRDVLFLSISSHGAQDPAIVVSNSQLPLNDLTNEDLADALDDSGIKWRVIVISACYAGGFVDSLKNPQTIVIAAAAADRTSFGCANDRDLTYFGEAFYRDALPGARSLREAFDNAKAAIAARELREHIDASNPQAYFGAELEAKLALMNPSS
jgi:Peptidase C13 family